MRRYTLRGPDLIESARCLRSLDDGRSAFNPGRAAPRKWDASAWAYETADESSYTGIVRAQLTSQALPIQWRHRNRATQAIWPPESDSITWAGIGAMHALAPLYPRPTFPIFKTDDQRPHALAYLTAYAAVFGAYAMTATQDDLITSHTVPGPTDSGEYGDPHSLAWSADIGKIAGAYARAQASMGDLIASHKAKIKTQKGADYEYSFANIADALKACLGAFNAQGCAVLQPVTTFKGGVEVRTVVIHESGQWLRSGILVLPATGDAQAIGSAITYARRYQILGMVGLAPSDDDGAAATTAARGSGHSYEHRAATRSAKPSPKGPPREPRCTGKAGHIAIANTKHRTDYARLSGRTVEDVWAGVLTRCRVPAVNGRAPEPHEITVNHGLAVRDKLKAGLAKLESEEDPLDRKPGEDDPADVEPPAEWPGHEQGVDPNTVKWPAAADEGEQS